MHVDDMYGVDGVGEQQQQQQRQHIDENLKRAEPGSITGGF